MNTSHTIPCLPTISATCSELGTGTHSVMFTLFRPPTTGPATPITAAAVAVAKDPSMLEPTVDDDDDDDTVLGRPKTGDDAGPFITMALPGGEGFDGDEEAVFPLSLTVGLSPFPPAAAAKLAASFTRSSVNCVDADDRETAADS